MWGAMLRTAMRFGVTPEAFWRLSLKEWRMLTAPERSAAPLGRPEFEALLARYPDETERT